MEVTPVDTNLADALGAEQLLGKEDFLALMVSQMQNQDPMDPLSNEAFVAQLAQFSALEQMQNLNTSFSGFANHARTADAARLINQEVSFINNSEELVEGTVNGVELTENDIFLTIDGHRVPLANVRSVNAPTTTPTE